MVGVLGILILVVVLLPKRLQERFRLTPVGLEGRMLRGRSIPWQAITRVEVRRSMLEPYVCLWLTKPDAYSGLGDGHRLWWVRRRSAKFGDVAFNFLLLSPSAANIAQEIGRRAAASIKSAV